MRKKLDLTKFEILSDNLRDNGESKVAFNAMKLVKKYYCLIHNDQVSNYNIGGEVVPKATLVDKLCNLTYKDLYKLVLKVKEILLSKRINKAYSFMVSLFYHGVIDFNFKKDITLGRRECVKNDYDFDEIEKVLVVNHVGQQEALSRDEIQAALPGTYNGVPLKFLEFDISDSDKILMRENEKDLEKLRNHEISLKEYADKWNNGVYVNENYDSTPNSLTQICDEEQNRPFGPVYNIEQYDYDFDEIERILVANNIESS